MRVFFFFCNLLSRLRWQITGSSSLMNVFHFMSFWWSRITFCYFENAQAPGFTEASLSILSHAAVSHHAAVGTGPPTTGKWCTAGGGCGTQFLKGSCPSSPQLPSCILPFCLSLPPYVPNYLPSPQPALSFFCFSFIFFCLPLALNYIYIFAVTRAMLQTDPTNQSKPSAN